MSLAFSAPTSATTVVYDPGTGYVTDILDLIVSGTRYDMTIVGGSYDAVFASGAPTFLDEASAGAAANAIRDALNDEPVVPTISASDDEILWVPFDLIGPDDFFTAQVGHDQSTDPWVRFASFSGPTATDWPAIGLGWYFAVFSESVPTPTTATLLVLGLFVGSACRRRRAP